MATLHSLAKNALPGTKFRSMAWPKNEWFQPVFCDPHGLYFGLLQSGHGTCYPAFGSSWELWQEPKPKIKRWLWSTLASRQISDVFYTDEEVPGPFFKKLEWSVTEFER